MLAVNHHRDVKCCCSYSSIITFTLTSEEFICMDLSNKKKVNSKKHSNFILWWKNFNEIKWIKINPKWVQTCALFFFFFLMLNIRPLTSAIFCYWASGAGWTEEALAAFPVHPPPAGQELLSRRSPQTPVETHSRTTSPTLSAKRHLRRGRRLCNAPTSVSGGCVCRRRRT